jgi:hypothetical protein
MVVFVKIDRTFTVGADPKLCSWREWLLGSLLDSAVFRNQFKYLVAIYKGNVIASFCIHGVARDGIAVPRRVRFALVDTEDACNERLRRIYRTLIDLGVVNKYLSTGYIYRDDIARSIPEFAHGFECGCELGNIPLYQEHEIVDGDIV